MQIKEIHIRHFGRLSDYRMTPTPGLNLFYGENEYGKSTVMAFVKAMFYGFGTSSQDLLKNERKRYKPWNGEKMSGSLIFTWQGTDYSLAKTFGDTRAGDRIQLVNLSTGEEVPLQKGEEVGSRLFCLGAGAFENTAFVGQMDSIPDSGRDKKGDVLSALTNLVSTGDAGTSYDFMKKRYKEARDAYVRPRGKNGVLDKLKAEESNLLLMREEALCAGRERRTLLEEIERCRLAAEETQILLKEIEKNIELQQQLQEKEEIAQTLEVQEKAEEAHRFWQKTKARLCFGETVVTEDTLSELRQRLQTLKEQNGALQNAKARSAAILQVKEDALADRIKVLTAAEKSATEADTALERAEELLEKAEKYQKQKQDDMIAIKRLQQESRILEIEITEKLAAAKEKRAQAEIALELSRTNVQTAQKNGSRTFLMFAVLFAIAAVVLGIWIHPIGFGLIAVSLLLLWKQKNNPNVVQEAEESARQAAETAAVQANAAVEKLVEDMATAKDRQASLEESITALEAESITAQTMYQGALTDCAAAKERQASAKHTKEAAQAGKIRAEGELAETKAIDLAEQTGLQKVLTEEKTALLSAMVPFGAFDELSAIRDWMVTMERALSEEKTAQEALRRWEEKAKLLLGNRSPHSLKERLEHLLHELPADGILLPEEEYQSLLTHRDGLQKALQESAVVAEGQKKELQHKFLHAPDIYDVEKRQKQVSEAIDEAQWQLDVLGTAEAVLDEAFTEMQQSFGPEVNGRTVTILRRLTHGKYEDAVVSRDLQVMVREKEDHSLRAWEYLSGGTADQVYLALRLAIADLVSPEGEHLPLFLDDILVQYDDVRMEEAVRFLQELGQECQILLFACHKRVLTAANEEKNQGKALA